MAFAPVFHRPFSATFDRRAAAAAAPWWYVAGKTCVAAYQPKGAASLAASYSNLANPGTYDAAPGVAPTWASATGWTFNGVDQYLISGVIATATTSILVRFSDYATNGRSLFGNRGSDTPQSRFYIIPNFNNSVSYNWGNAGQSNQSPGLAAGVLGFAANQPYRNGNADGAAIAAAWGGNPAHAIPLGCFVRITNVYDLFLAANIQAAVIYSDTLTAGEVATVSAAMAAL